MEVRPAQPDAEFEAKPDALCAKIDAKVDLLHNDLRRLKYALFGAWLTLLIAILVH